MTGSPTSASHTRAYDPDPACLVCAGTGVRHHQGKNALGFFVGRDVCPCTILGPLAEPEFPPVASYRRDLSELPPIKDTAVLDQYPDCQPRTPIDPIARILSPGLQRGNADLPPATRGHLAELRDCTVCAGRGASRGVVCKGCNGAGRVKR